MPLFSDAELISCLRNENATLRKEVNDLKSELSEKSTLLLQYQNDSIKHTMESVKNRQLIANLKKKLFRHKNVKKDKKKHEFYTGISVPKFDWIVDGLSQVKTVSNLLTRSDHLFIVIAKLRVGLSNVDLAYRVGVNSVIISKIYRQWLPALAEEMSKLIIWPEKMALRRSMPKCFKPTYLKCTCIIDCTEIFIERPQNLNTRAQTWSTYKNHNTIKYLVICSPSGAVSFMSEGWSGRVSDKEITTKSGFLDYIEHGDQVLADRGFTIEEELAACGGILVIPHFTHGKEQMSAAQVDESRHISNVRVHIERVIGRLRTYKILNTTIPIPQVDLLDHVMVSVSGLINMNKSVV